MITEESSQVKEATDSQGFHYSREPMLKKIRQCKAVKKYWAKNRDKIRARNKQYYEKNHEKINEHRRLLYVHHPLKSL